MAVQRDKCSRCSSVNCVLGSLTYTTPWMRWSAKFEAFKANPFALSRNAAVAGVACLDCGHLELVIDVERVDKLTKGRRDDP